MTKLDQLKLLITCAKMLSNSYICPESPRNFDHWWKIVKFTHTHGWLFVGFDNKEIYLVAVAYKVPEVDAHTGDELPIVEGGDIVYVPLMVSTSKDKLKPLRMLRYYLSQNPDVKEIAYSYRGTNRIKRFTLRSQDGKIKVTESA